MRRASQTQDTMQGLQSVLLGANTPLEGLPLAAKRADIGYAPSIEERMSVAVTTP